MQGLKKQRGNKHLTIKRTEGSNLQLKEQKDPINN